MTTKATRRDVWRAALVASLACVAATAAAPPAGGQSAVPIQLPAVRLGCMAPYLHRDSGISGMFELSSVPRGFQASRDTLIETGGKPPQTNSEGDLLQSITPLDFRGVRPARYYFQVSPKFPWPPRAHPLRQTKHIRVRVMVSGRPVYSNPMAVTVIPDLQSELEVLSAFETGDCTLPELWPSARYSPDGYVSHLWVYTVLRGSRVTVTCRLPGGAPCPSHGRQVHTRRIALPGHRPFIENLEIRLGRRTVPRSLIAITVTHPGMVGRYARYRLPARNPRPGPIHDLPNARRQGCLAASRSAIRHVPCGWPGRLPR